MTLFVTFHKSVITFSPCFYDSQYCLQLLQSNNGIRPVQSQHENIQYTNISILNDIIRNRFHGTEIIIDIITKGNIGCYCVMKFKNGRDYILKTKRYIHYLPLIFSDVFCYDCT